MTDESAVLTWPEGNGWIVKQLKTKLQSKIRNNSLVFRLEIGGKKFWSILSPQENRTTRIRAREVIYACPRKFARRMIVGISQTDDRFFR